MTKCYVEGEIKEIKFESGRVLFSLESSAEFRRKEGDREFVLLINSDKKEESAKLLPIDTFKNVFFICKSFAMRMQIATMKVNRCKVRVLFDYDKKNLAVVNCAECLCK